MPHFFTEDSLNANVGSFWATYMQEISRQGDLLREAEVVPLCRRLGIGFVTGGLMGFQFHNKELTQFDFPDEDFKRVCKLMNVHVPGTNFVLGAFVGDVKIE